MNPLLILFCEHYRPIVVLFSFEGVGEILTDLQFVDSTDVQLLKEEKVNIGNYIFVLGAGFKNAFSGSYNSSANKQTFTHSSGKKNSVPAKVLAKNIKEIVSLKTN